MYAIKHQDDGVETTKPVGWYRFDSRKKELIGYGGPLGELRYTTGVVYAMNEEGETIGIYALTQQK